MLNSLGLMAIDWISALTKIKDSQIIGVRAKKKTFIRAGKEHSFCGMKWSEMGVI